MIQGTDDVLTITGRFDWTFGALNGTGTTNIGPAGLLSISGRTALASRRIINNAGYAVWTHGDIAFSAEVQLNNLGGATFDIQSDGRLGGSLFFRNDGIVRSRGSSVISGTGLFTNAATGVLKVESGTLIFDQGATYNYGVYDVAAGAVLGLRCDADFFFGSSLVTGGGTVGVGGTHDHLDGAWDFTGTTAISSYTLDALGQAPIRTGALVLSREYSGGYINFDGGAAVTVGTLTMDGYSTFRGRDNITVMNSLTTTRDITMSGAGSVTVLGGPSTLAGTIADGFTINLESETTLGPITLANAATINNKSRAETTLRGGAGYIDGSGVFNNTGTVIMVGSIAYSIYAGVRFSNNGGTLHIQSGILAFAGTYIQNAGTTDINAGATLRAGGLVDIEDGILSGSGTVDASVYSAGEADPGRVGEAGVLTITRDYTQVASGVLNIEIGGPNPADFDGLVVSGQATLGGTLAVRLLNGYVPKSGDSFTILTFASVSADFTAYEGLDLGGGLYFDPQYSDNGLTLVTMSPLPPHAGRDKY
jgi:hypothetical protein